MTSTTKPADGALRSDDLEMGPDGTYQLEVSGWFHRGPLPEPGMLQRYDDVVPGAAERIIQMAEVEGDHRRGLEQLATRSHFELRVSGQRWGAGLLGLAMVCGTYLVGAGHNATGLAMVIGAVALPVVAFATGKVIEQAATKDRKEPATDDSNRDSTER